MALVEVYTRQGIVGLIPGGQLTIDGVNHGPGALSNVAEIVGETPQRLIEELSSQIDLAATALSELKSQSER